MHLPYSEACQRNSKPIFAIIRPLLADARLVLEIGSGTGQHAVYFAARMPHLIWQPSDLKPNHDGIRMWLQATGLKNVRPPLLLDVTTKPWPVLQADAVFTANTFHIMHWRAVEATITEIGWLLPAGKRFLVYGPFNYGGACTSESNARFDQWLKQRDPGSGIRDFEDLDKLAAAAGMSLEADYPLPANNRLLCWVKKSSGWTPGPAHHGNQSASSRPETGPAQFTRLYSTTNTGAKPRLPS